MPGHGEYRLDPTVGIGRTEDLPNTKISMPSRCYLRHPYPHCGRRAYLDRSGRRILHDLGNLLTERLRDVVVL
jgi:hypothetical protein